MVNKDLSGQVQTPKKSNGKILVKGVKIKTCPCDLDKIACDGCGKTLCAKCWKEECKNGANILFDQKTCSECDYLIVALIKSKKSQEKFIKVSP